MRNRTGTASGASQSTYLASALAQPQRLFLLPCDGACGPGSAPPGVRISQQRDPTHVVRITLFFHEPQKSFTRSYPARESEIVDGRLLEEALIDAAKQGACGNFTIVELEYLGHHVTHTR